MKKLPLLFFIALAMITGISMNALGQSKKDQAQHEEKITINKKGEP